jgi:hypothetical protein
MIKWKSVLRIGHSPYLRRVKNTGKELIKYNRQNQTAFFPQGLTTLKFKLKIAFAIFAAMNPE